jgi:hypothetical protein
LAAAKCNGVEPNRQTASKSPLADAPAAPILGAVLFLPSLYRLGNRGALTSAPRSINIFTTLTLPPEQAA